MWRADRPQVRPRYAEPLEDRRLLSGVAFPATMNVVEPDGSVPVTVADLPPEVRASLDAHVAEAESLGAALTVLDGQLRYRFTSSTGEQSFELTLTPHGDAVAPEAAAARTHVRVLD